MRVSFFSVFDQRQWEPFEEHPFIAAVSAASKADEQRNLLNTERASDFVTSQMYNGLKRQTATATASNTLDRSCHSARSLCSQLLKTVIPKFENPAFRRSAGTVSFKPCCNP
jgi:hypothetical protein